MFRRISVWAAVVVSASVTPLLFGQGVAATQPQPPIPIRFRLEKPSLVTLVVEDAAGKRVRNLVSEMAFPAGQNTVYWDALDDLGRDTDAAAHATYSIPGKLVAAGDYSVRGLAHLPLDIRYQLTPYFHGTPPWMTEDRSSGWTANHSPPSGICFIPGNAAPVRAAQKKAEPLVKESPAQVLIGSHVSEGGAGIAWVDLNGRKLHGQEWLGGVWTGAEFVTRDAGPRADPDVYAYTGAFWEGDKFNGFRSELRLHALNRKIATAPKDKRFGTGEDVALFTPAYKVEAQATLPKRPRFTGLAVHNGILVASIQANDQLLFVDARKMRVLGVAKLDAPEGLAFDAGGKLWAVSGKKVFRFDGLPEFPARDGAEPTENTTSNSPELALPKGSVVIGGQLESPKQLAFDGAGNLFVSDHGESHQVKKFSATGTLLQTIGEAGAPRLGPYNKLHMNNPMGITVDNRNRLWVAEHDYLPKRISVWSLEEKGATNAKLVEAFYGPPLYGAGGTLDPVDTERYFLSGTEFKLDWKTGGSEPVSVYTRSSEDRLRVLRSDAYTAPETPIHVGGRTYLADSYNVSPTSGIANAGLWLLEGGVARPVAYIGQANDFAAFTPGRSFSVRWTGQIVAPASEEFTFSLGTTHGGRLYINGKPVITNWRNWGGDTTGKITLEANKRYDIVVEMYHKEGPARMTLSWATGTMAKKVVPSAALFATSDANEKRNGLTATYFGDKNHKDELETRVDKDVNFSWGKAGLQLSTPAPFRDRLPKGFDPSKENAIFAWSDLNDDGQVQAEEVTTAAGTTGTVNFLADLSAVTASGWQLKPASFTKGGAPVFDAAKLIRIVPAGTTQGPTSTGGNQALLDSSGKNFMLTTAPKPYAAQSLGGALSGVPTWSYPTLWPGLHASHNAPLLTDAPGVLIGTTRLLGMPFTPAKSGVGELFAINGNKGTIYLFTMDGLFVSTLFRDCRTASWNAPEAVAGMSVKDLSLNEECFYPSATCTVEGQLYIQGGGRILKVEGLETLQPIASQKITVTGADLAKAQQYFMEQEAARQAALRQAANLSGTIEVVEKSPTVDGKMDEWKDAAWLTIDERTVQVGDWGKRKVKTEAALRIAKDELFIAVRTDRDDLLKNTGESLQNLFKTGGGIDLMLGTNPKADAKRKSAVDGDIRLLVTQVDGKTTAVLFQPVVKGGVRKGEQVLFSSPVRSIAFDRVEDVSKQVTVAFTAVRDQKNAIKEATYEVAIPLKTLGLVVEPGDKLLGDIGILRGNGYQALQRVYWSNKATGLMSDITYEAELTPGLWAPMTVK